MKSPISMSIKMPTVFGRWSTLGVAIALFAGALFPASCRAAEPASAIGFGRAMWVWQAGVIDTPELQNSLFDFAARKNIKVLYVSTGSIFIEPEIGAKKRQISAEQLGAFLRRAHEKGFKVQALDGDPSHVLAKNHARILARLQRALDYNKTAPAAERLDGWQWDSEPYVMPEFRESLENRHSLWRQLLDSAVQSRDAVLVAQKEMPHEFALGYAVPFWMDNPERETIEWNGATKPAGHHLMDVLNALPNSYIAIMAYRDTTGGSNGSIAVTAGEAEYATKHAPNVKVWIGQETLDVKGDPPSITFWQEGEGALNEAISQLQAHYASTPAVAGVAIHHWVPYTTLSERAEIEAAGGAAAEFKITSPQVGPTARETIVTGTATAGQKIIVGVKPDGDIWYDQKPVTVGVNGQWSVPVRVGNENTPVGRGFTIRAIVKDAQDQTVGQQEVKVTRQ